MKKTLFGITFLLITKLCWAEGYETKTVFVTDIPPDAIFINKYGPPKLGLALGNCIRGTEEENDENKLSAMLEASIAHYIANLAYLANREEEARLNGRERSRDTKYMSAFEERSTDALLRYTDALLKKADLFSEAMNENALCRMKISYFFNDLADVAPDINNLTKEGWEIKSTRRAWMDLWANKEIEDFEWGTEYVLQKPVQDKKQSGQKMKKQGK